MALCRSALSASGSPVLLGSGASLAVAFLERRMAAGDPIVLQRLMRLLTAPLSSVTDDTEVCMLHLAISVQCAGPCVAEQFLGPMKLPKKHCKGHQHGHDTHPKSATSPERGICGTARLMSLLRVLVSTMKNRLALPAILEAEACTRQSCLCRLCLLV